MSNLLLVFMFLFFTIPTIIYKQYFLAFSFILFSVIFGLFEYIAYYYSGNTVTQHMLLLIEDHGYKGYIILGSMLLGCICLILHLGLRFGE